MVVTVPPWLQITSTPPNVQLSWPTTPPGFQLQRTTALEELPAWTAVAGNPQSIDGVFYLSLPPGDEQAYFRLFRSGTSNTPPTVTASLLRGPYLQVATPRSIRVRFRTNRSVAGQLRYGTTTNYTHTLGDTAGTDHEFLLDNLTPATRY